MFNEENDGCHIQEIIERTSCARHDTPLNTPCWMVPYGSGIGYSFAICNSRAVQAHYTGIISIEAIEPKPHGGRNVRTKRSR